MGRVAGKVALVTAAGQGIGRAVADALAAEGASVIATDLRTELFEGSVGTFSAVRRLDVLDRAAVFELVRSVGPLDILVNCAGVVHDGTILDASDDEWTFAFNLNGRATFWTMQAALPAMLERQAGSIVNISSVASSVKGVPRRFVYGASKAAIVGMTKAVAADYVSDGIRANVVCPGTVDSPSWQERVKSQAAAASITEAESRAAFVARQPMGRVGTPQEIANLVVYLASDESSFTTGQVHVVDGGWTA